MSFDQHSPSPVEKTRDLWWALFSNKGGIRVASNTAAFIRVEGTLIKRGALSMASYFGANAMGVRERLFRLGAITLASPVISVLSQSDRGLANRMAYFVTRDMTKDRLAILADEYYDLFIRDRLLDRGLELLKQVRREGHKVVLLSEGLDMVMDNVRDDFGRFDELCTNRLEFRNNRATGKLETPIIGGHETARWIRDYAAENQIDLKNSCAYASCGGDLTLLTSVGQPCAANPDFALRRASREMDWPVIDYDL